METARAHFSGFSNTRVLLHLEDDDNHALVFQRALREAEWACAYNRVRDGEEAVLYLQGVGMYADRGMYPLPDLILSELYMPRMNGFEFLAWLRAQPGFTGVPCVIFTDSTSSVDFVKATQIGATHCVAKPADLHLCNKSLRDMLS